MLTVKTKPVVLVAYVLLLLPVMLFFCGWLHLYVGIPASIMLVIGFVWIWRKDFVKADKAIKIPIGHLLGIIAVIALFVALAGVAGIGDSGYDAPWRYAIFHDLIDNPWPVVYSNGNALVYYCIFWLPAALVGKMLGWSAACFAMWAFITAIVVTSYLLIVLYLRIETSGKMWIACAFLLLWSGMTYLGMAFMSMVDPDGYKDFTLLCSGDGYMDCLFNGESFNYYYRSNAIALRMTFNQLPYWLIVPLMLQNRTAHSYMYLGLLLLPYSPWTFIGIIPLMVVLAIPDLKRRFADGRVKRVLSSIFSPANFLALVTLLPIFAIFFMASARTGAAGGSGYVISPEQVASYVEQGLEYSTHTGSFGVLSLNRFSVFSVAGLVIFWLLEFGVYMFLIAPSWRKKPVFWVMLVVLMLCPLIWVGTVSGRDFCMNASLPALFLLMIMVLQYVLKHVVAKPLGLRSLCLVLALFIAFGGTVLGEMGEVGDLITSHSIAAIDDSIGTLSDKPVDDYLNFLNAQPQEKAFFKYLAR